jgi:hypothetical protein
LLRLVKTSEWFWGKLQYAYKSAVKKKVSKWRFNYLPEALAVMYDSVILTLRHFDENREYSSFWLDDHDLEKRISHK